MSPGEVSIHRDGRLAMEPLLTVVLSESADELSDKEDKEHRHPTAASTRDLGSTSQRAPRWDSRAPVNHTRGGSVSPEYIAGASSRPIRCRMTNEGQILASHSTASPALNEPGASCCQTRRLQGGSCVAAEFQRRPSENPGIHRYFREQHFAYRRTRFGSTSAANGIGKTLFKIRSCCATRTTGSKKRRPNECERTYPRPSVDRPRGSNRRQVTHATM